MLIILGLQGKVAFVFGGPAKTRLLGLFARVSQRLVSRYTSVIRKDSCPESSIKGQITCYCWILPSRVASDADTKEFFDSFSKENPGIKADILIHAIGFAPRECFDRPILFVDDDKINTAFTISANSLQRCLKFALPYLNPGSSTITLTYAASTRYVPSYGIMSMAKAALECWTRELACHLGPEGHRVNSISSGSD